MAKKKKTTKKTSKIVAKKVAVTRPLSVIEQRYIAENPKIAVNDIYAELDGEVSKEDIEHLQVALANPEEGIKTLKAGDLMARHGKGEGSSIVMTSGASALTEELKKSAKKKKDTHNDRIHRIRK